MIKDFFSYAMRNLIHRKLRSWLTMIGIFIGIAAVVALVSLGQGLEKYVDEEFEKLGTDKLFITPKGMFGGPGTGSAAKLTMDDYNFVKDISGIAGTNYIAVANSPVEFKDSQIFKNIFGLSYDPKEYKVFAEAYSTYGIGEGRDLKESDRFKATIGIDYTVKELFDKKVKLGDTIKIKGKDVKVVGIWERIGNPDDDSNILIDINTFKEIFPEKGDNIDYIYIKISDPAQTELMEQRITEKLRKHRGLEAGKEDFDVQSPVQLLETFLTIFGVIQAVIIGIASISLLVGGIGITNTMYTAVLERTKEIGIMKSIGARNSDILLLFVIEAGTLGLVGGAIGVLIGMGIAEFVQFIATAILGSALLKAYFPWYLIIGCLAFSFIIGIIAGATPARQASKLKPVDALRYE